jgi:hypothetical protein
MARLTPDPSPALCSPSVAAGHPKLGHMAQQKTVPSYTVIIDRPLCIVCGAQMWLACVEADGPNNDKRTFECPVCATHEIEFVKFK